MRDQWRRPERSRSTIAQTASKGSATRSRAMAASRSQTVTACQVQSVSVEA